MLRSKEEGVEIMLSIYQSQGQGLLLKMNVGEDSGKLTKVEEIQEHSHSEQEKK